MTDCGVPLTTACRCPAPSTSLGDEPADLVGRGKDHVGPVAHHPGSHEGRQSFLRAVVADVGLEPQISLPEVARLSVRRRDAVGITTMAIACTRSSGSSFLRFGT